MYSRRRNKLLDTSLAIVSRLHFHSRVSLEWFVRQSPLMAHVWKELEAAQEQQWLFVLFGDARPAVCCHSAPLPGVVYGTWSLYDWASGGWEWAEPRAGGCRMEGMSWAPVCGCWVECHCFRAWEMLLVGCVLMLLRSTVRKDERRGINSPIRINLFLIKCLSSSPFDPPVLPPQLYLLIFTWDAI